ncbi:MAG: adenosylcobinamide-GDP ribazoletransferase [Xenococcaceae cyanobacterium MO_207.B15]|nr:adenosylcobinamide-GDP ribazoletransferase [Xenococcaceae cyanobacterium MO_207.B15]
MTQSFRQWVEQLFSSFVSAVVFYTIIPIPYEWAGNWDRITRWCCFIGLIIGLLLGLGDIGLNYCYIPPFTRSALIIALWVGLTGGFHLDGAMDTADGLAVTDPTRRLEVMRDSATGAFGAIAAGVILLLKTASLSEITGYSWLCLMLAAGWGRFGQISAIALYPYLREEGKGAIHKKNLRLPQDIVVSLIPLLGCSSLLWWLLPWWKVILIILGCNAIALVTGYYFYLQLQGHTGDTYGAVVEWSEALILCMLTGYF